MRSEWSNFVGGLWESEINVRDFIQKNYKPYDGDESFLVGPTEATEKLWGKLKELQKEERSKGGVLDMETEVVTSLTAYGAAYIDEDLKDLEQVVGLQTDKPLSVHLCLTAALRWLNSHARCTVMSQALSFTKSLQNITRHITRVYSISTHLK